MMAEQEHEARLAAVKASYEAEIERLREALRVERHEHHRRTQMTEYPSITANLLWNMDSVRRIDAALAYSASQESLAAASQPSPQTGNANE
jgi:hypothetical protein